MQYHPNFKSFTQFFVGSTKESPILGRKLRTLLCFPLQPTGWHCCPESSTGKNAYFQFHMRTTPQPSYHRNWLLKFSEIFRIPTNWPNSRSFIQRLPLTLAKEKPKDCDELCKTITEFVKPITSRTIIIHLYWFDFTINWSSRLWQFKIKGLICLSISLTHKGKTKIMYELSKIINGFHFPHFKSEIIIYRY